jgi:hypothetical protein
MATRAEKLAMIASIATGEPNTALEIRNILTELLDPPSGTIMMKDVSNAYITSNFDGSGLGINEEAGYAIVNGNNGTRNWNDRMPLAYGTTNAVMGATKGSNTQTLSVANIPPLNVPYTGSSVDNGDDGALIITAATGSNGTKNLTTGGTSTAFSIEPKTIVTLITMKL